MSTKLLKQDPPDRDDGPKRQEDSVLEAVVGQNVLSVLGHPAGLHRMQVKRVWGDNYRVNIFVGSDAASLTVAHSYFLRADGKGNILAAFPPVTKTY